MDTNANAGVGERKKIDPDTLDQLMGRRIFTWPNGLSHECESTAHFLRALNRLKGGQTVLVAEPGYGG